MDPRCQVPAGLTDLLRFGAAQVVFTVSAPAQLLGVGLCGADLPFTATVSLEEARKEHLVDSFHDPVRLQTLAFVMRWLSACGTQRDTAGLMPEADYTNMHVRIRFTS